MTQRSQQPASSQGDARQARFARMLAQDGHSNVAGFLHEAAHFYRGVSLPGRAVLEIGSGRGLMTLYTAVQGPARIVSMEPEMIGSRSGMIELQQRRIAALQLRNVELVAADFNVWDPGSQVFDVVICRAAINHLYASDKHALSDPATYRGYVDVVKKIRRVLNPGGVALITDACRYAFFTATRDLGLRRPWHWARTGIDWHHHQNPGTWRRIFLDADFSAVQIRYPLPHRLRALSGVVDSALPNFFLEGGFILKAVR